MIKSIIKSPSGFIGFDHTLIKIITTYYSKNDFLFLKKNGHQLKLVYRLSTLSYKCTFFHKMGKRVYFTSCKHILFSDCKIFGRKWFWKSFVWIWLSMLSTFFKYIYRYTYFSIIINVWYLAMYRLFHWIVKPKTFK